jgi:hypothetical protein
MIPSFPRWGFRSPLRLSKFQSSIAGVKTPCIEAFFKSLESYRSVDIENGLTWAIWTSIAQVMMKRKVGSWTVSLIPDHQKSRIDPIPVCVNGAQHTVGKLLTRAITLLQTSLRSKVYTWSYALSKFRESQLLEFWDSHLGISGQKAIWMWPLWKVAEYNIWGKVVASPKSRSWWSLWV